MRVRVREGDLSWTETGEEIVILDLRTSQYLQLNGSAAVLWELCVRGVDLDELATHLRRTFGLDDLEARQDAAAFVQQLDDLQLLDRGFDGSTSE